MLKRVWVGCLVLFFSVSRAFAFPELTGQVVDNAHILSFEQKEHLIQTLQQVAPHQMVAVSLSTLDGKEIEEYGVALGRYWGIGQKGVNDGVLVLIAPNQRQMRIEVGYGLEGTLTDAKCSQIINRIMLPLAKQGKYADSLIRGSEAVVSLLGGKVVPELQQTSRPATNTRPLDDSFGFLDNTIFFMLLLFPIMTFGAIFFVIWMGISSSNKTSKKSKAIIPKCKIPTTEAEKALSRKDRRQFFFAILPMSLFYLVFLIAGAVLLKFLLPFGIVWMIFIGFHCFLFIGGVAYSSWKKNPYFPYQEYKKHIKSGKGSGGSGTWHSSSGGWSSHSSGSSFRGGGGSFGGGGSSGRW